MALDFFAGCVGGAAGVIVGHPLDTVKVRLQTQDPTNLKYRGTFHCLSTIVKQESVSGLYKGISSPLFGVAGVNAIIFGVYGALRPYVSSSPGNDALWAHFAAGSISGAVQSVVASPMELVKTRMQINQDSVGTKKAGAMDVLRGIYKNEGGLFKGVFKGWGITLTREIPGFGFYFASYEALTRIGDGQVSTLGMMLAGGMAGVISWIVTFPIDVVKTRLQCDDRGRYTGIIDCIRKTYSAEGHHAFSRGLVSTVIRAFPTNAATFTVVTWIMRFAGETPEDDVQNARQYLDELLTESAQLQEKFEQSLRLRVPHYLLNSSSAGSSLTSCSLAAQCASSAQKYVDRTQVYFNFYQSLQQQQGEHSTAAEEECVGVESKQPHVSLLLHEKLAISINTETAENCSAYVNNSIGKQVISLSGDEQQATQNVMKTDGSASSRSCEEADDDNNKQQQHNRIGDNAVRHNNHQHHIPSSTSTAVTATTKLSASGAVEEKNESPVKRETSAKTVNATAMISCDETESATSSASASVARTSMGMNTNMKLSDDEDDERQEDRNSGSIGMQSNQGNERVSHEASSFPVQVIKSGITFAATTGNGVDNGVIPTTGAVSSEEEQRTAAEYLNSYEEHQGNPVLSDRDLTYLSKSLDIPAHIINAASLQQKYRAEKEGNGGSSCTKSEAKVSEKRTRAKSSSVALTRPSRTGANAPTANSANKTAQAWRKYCTTPALKFCKCFEDHCVCYV